MGFKRLALLLLLLLVVAILVPMSLFTVDRTQFVYVTRFGRHVATYDGAIDEQAGLHFKWPWPIESVTRLDRRLQTFDLPGAELLTRDAERNTIDKTLTIDAYVCWRITDPDRFIRSVGTLSGAESLLAQRVNSELGAAIGKRSLDDLISTTPGRVDEQRGELRRLLLDRTGGDGESSLRDLARNQYGIEVVDVRLRRLNHPAAVRYDIYDRIRSERKRKADEYTAEGERQASEIRSRANRKVAELKAEAEAEAIRQRGLADAEADRIRNEAALQDPQFYAFLKKLEEYERILGDGKSMLLLSTHRELFDTLFNPPKPGMSTGSGIGAVEKKGTAHTSPGETGGER
jgi:membrane protease subunit HflC